MITAHCAHLLIQEYCAGMHLAERFNNAETKALTEIKEQIVLPKWRLQNIVHFQIVIFAISVYDSIADIISKKTMCHPIFQSEGQYVKYTEDGDIVSAIFHYSFHRESQIIEACKNKGIRQKIIKSIMAAETLVPHISPIRNSFASSSAYQYFFSELGPHNALSLLKRRLPHDIEIEGSQGIVHANEKEQMSEVMTVGCLPLLHIVGAKELTISHCTLGPLLYTAEAWKKVRPPPPSFYQHNMLRAYASITDYTVF